MRSRPRHLPCFSSLALIACAALLQGCCKYRWESKGPFEMSGAIRHLLVDPINGHSLYAAAENGGLWFLDDYHYPEKGWLPLTDNLATFQINDARVAPEARALQMRGIAKSSVDPHYIVTANAAGFVYHSKDHGKTWSKVTDRNFGYIRKILIAERETQIRVRFGTRKVKEKRLWIACRLGLFRLRLLDDVLNSVDQLYPQTPAQAADVLDAVRNSLNDDLYVGVRNQGVWKRPDVPADLADAWTLSADWATFGDAQTAMIKLAITPGGSRLVAKLGRNVIVNDADGASTGWTVGSPVGFGDDVGGSDIGYRGNYSNARGEWSHAIAISPTNQNVIAVGQVSLFISSSGGLPGAGGTAAWAGVDRGHEDMQSLAFSPDGDSLFIANDGGVFQHSLPVSSGDEPKDLNTKLTTAQFFRVGLNGKVAVGNVDHQGIWGTLDIEASPVVWKRATPSGNGFGTNGLENDFVSADPRTPGRFFVQFDSEHLLRLKFSPTSTGAAQDLLPINPTTTPLRPFTLKNNPANRPVFNQLNYPVGAVAVDPRAGTNTMLVAVHVNYTSFGIQKTQNANVDPSGGPKIPCPDPPPTPPVGGCFDTPVTGTADWTPVYDPSPPDPTPIVSIAFSPETEIKGTFSIGKKWKAYALNQDGQTFVLGNVDAPADTFQPAGSFAAVQPDFARQIVADPRIPGRLLALSHFQIHLSTDGNAATWNPIGQATLPPSAQLNALCLHPTNSKILYLATANAGVLVSEDGGASWGWIGLGLPNVPVMDVFTSPTHLYAVTFGRGLWRAKL